MESFKKHYNYYRKHVNYDCQYNFKNLVQSALYDIK